jgi:hypothetical protein
MYVTLCRKSGTDITLIPSALDKTTGQSLAIPPQPEQNQKYINVHIHVQNPLMMMLALFGTKLPLS